LDQLPAAISQNFMMTRASAFNLLLLALLAAAQPAKSQSEAAPHSQDSYTFQISAKLPEYSFHLRRDEESTPTAIDVIRDNSLLQTLEVPDEVDAPPPGMPAMAVEDVNGDSYADLKFLHWWGATGNRTYFYWLFDPESGKFVYIDKLAELSNVTPDPKTHEIKTHSDLGSAGNSYTDQVFRFESKDLVLIREVKQEWSDEQRCFLNVVSERGATGMQLVHSQCVEVK
jgi:hypothetical protein